MHALLHWGLESRATAEGEIAKTNPKTAAESLA